MQLLDARRLGRGHDEDEIRNVFELATGASEQRYNTHAARLGGLRGTNQVGTLPGRRMQHEQVTRLGQRLDLPGEDFIEAHVVGACREQRRVGRECDRAHRRPVRLVAYHVLSGDVLGVGGAPAVSRKEQRAAEAQRALEPLGHRRDLIRLLRGDLAGEGRETVQGFPDFRDAHFTASTNASRPPSPPRVPSSPCGPSSTTVPMTTKSAPAFRAARASAGVRMPPPTNSGTRGTAARQARITSGDTGRSAPLPASRYTACIPMRVAAVACAAASSGLSAGSGRVWLTDSTLVTRPPSMRM